MVLDPALGVGAARLGGARVAAVLLDACKVRRAVLILGALGLGRRCIRHNHMRRRRREEGRKGKRREREHVSM